jgi:hypothetical protein
VSLSCQIANFCTAWKPWLQINVICARRQDAYAKAKQRKHKVGSH